MKKIAQKFLFILGLVFLLGLVFFLAGIFDAAPASEEAEEEVQEMQEVKEMLGCVKETHRARSILRSLPKSGAWYVRSVQEKRETDTNHIRITITPYRELMPSVPLDWKQELTNCLSRLSESDPYIVSVETFYGEPPSTEAEKEEEKERASERAALALAASEAETSRCTNLDSIFRCLAETLAVPVPARDSVHYTLIQIYFSHELSLFYGLEELRRILQQDVQSSYFHMHFPQDHNLLYDREEDRIYSAGPDVELPKHEKKVEIRGQTGNQDNQEYEVLLSREDFSLKFSFSEEEVGSTAPHHTLLFF